MEGVLHSLDRGLQGCWQGALRPCQAWRSVLLLRAGLTTPLARPGSVESGRGILLVPARRHGKPVVRRGPSGSLGHALWGAGSAFAHVIDHRYNTIGSIDVRNRRTRREVMPIGTLWHATFHPI
jgi:hypothetical protein